MATNTDPEMFRQMIREEFINAMNMPMASLHSADFIGYNQVLGADTVQPEAVVTVTTSDGTSEGLTTGTYTVDPNTVWLYPPDDSGTFRISPHPFTEPRPIPPTADQILELMRATTPNRNPIVPLLPEAPLSEMIQTVHFYPDGQCVIMVNGPKINGPDQNLSPEQIKILDRELKAAIIRAFSLVTDLKKLQEYKRTLIVD